MFRIICLSFIAFLMSCAWIPMYKDSFPQTPTGRTDDFYIQIKNNDQNRDQVLEDSKKIYESALCKESDLCIKICDGIFKTRVNKEECQTLSETQVEQFKGIVKVLKQPGITDLKRINLYDFKVFLNVSPEGVERAIRRVGVRNAKSLLQWAIDDERVATIFDEEDGDYVILEAILDEIKNDPIEALQVNIYGGNTVQEVALEKNNLPALRWFHGLIENECSSSRRKYNQKENWCVLGHYCSIIKNNFNDEAKDKLLISPDLAGIVEDVLQNPPDGAGPYFKSLNGNVDNITDLYDDVCTRFCTLGEVNEC